MRALIGFVLVAVLLVLVGQGLRRAATIEERLADADTQLITTGGVSPDMALAIDEAIAPASQVETAVS